MISTLRVIETRNAGTAVLRLEGTLDIPGASAVLLGVAAATAAGARSVICDLEGLRDTPEQHLLTVFPATQHRIGPWPQHDLHLAAASPFLARQLRQVRIDRFVAVHPTLDDALSVTHALESALHRHLELAPDLDSPARARHCLDALPKAGFKVWHDPAELVISELTTNALRHTSKPFTLALALMPTQLLISVTDATRQEPILRPVRYASGGGRGMQLVDAVSHSWGVRLIHQGGKSVWASIAVAG